MNFRYEQDFLTLRKKALLVSTQRQWRNKLKKRKALLNFKKNYGKGCPCVTPCLKSFCYITKHEFYGKGPGEGCSSFKEQGRLSQALNRKWYRACFPEEEN